MAKKILILSPNFSVKGQPVAERSMAYVDFFQSNNIETEILQTPKNMFELFKIITYIYKNNFNNILITMPPFRNWVLLLLPKVNAILDIRDGWSIAMQSGYGGISKPNKLKASIAKIIEYIGINQAKLTITCTPGLQKYLQIISNQEILLIPNGYTQEDKEIVHNIPVIKNYQSVHNEVKFICAGKFSEYGIDKVKIILKKIYEKYPNDIIFTVVGANIQDNQWIFEYIETQNFTNIKLRLLDRVDRIELYGLIIESDVAVTVIRDAEYDFGTKIFDYILCNKPIFNYFDHDNAFTQYFSGFFEGDTIINNTSFLRNELLNNEKKNLLKVLK